MTTEQEVRIYTDEASLSLGISEHAEEGWNIHTLAPTALPETSKTNRLCYSVVVIFQRELPPTTK